MLTEEISARSQTPQSDDSLKVYMTKKVWTKLNRDEKRHTIKCLAALMLDWKEIPNGEDRMLVSGAIKCEKDDVVSQAPNPSDGWNQRQLILYAISSPKRDAILSLGFFPEHSEGLDKINYNATKGVARLSTTKSIISNYPNLSEDDQRDAFGTLVDLSKKIEKEQQKIIEQRIEEAKKKAAEVAKTLTPNRNNEEEKEWAAMSDCIDLFYGAKATKNMDDLNTLKEMIIEDAERINPEVLSQLPDENFKSFVIQTLKENKKYEAIIAMKRNGYEVA